MLADNDSVGTTLISGDPELCKTFLFEAAVSCAKDGQQAFYFAARQLDSLPPVFHDRSEPSADALRFITFVTYKAESEEDIVWLYDDGYPGVYLGYTPTYEELAGQLIKLHTYQKPPSLLLVDDLDEFASYPGARGCSRESHVARCCALVINAAFNCSKVLNAPVRVCAASFAKIEDSEDKVYGMYFDSRWIITSEPGDSAGDEGRRVWMRMENGTKALEFQRLDDAVLVLRRIFLRDDDA